MRLAAGSLLVGNPRMKGLIPVFRDACQKAGNDEARILLELLLADAYASAENGPELKTVSAEILKKYPASYILPSWARRGWRWPWLSAMVRIREHLRAVRHQRCCH